jgi:hypothetical protein
MGSTSAYLPFKTDRGGKQERGGKLDKLFDALSVYFGNLRADI